MARAPVPTWIWLSRHGKLPDRVELPGDPGSYVLLLALRRNRRLSVGRLGVFSLRRGTYLYCGSARGPGGIRRRLARHLRTGGPLHWHIDSLLRAARPVAIAFVTGDSSWECGWSQGLGRQPNASFPIPGFGASDCLRRCPSHLVFLPSEPSGILGSENGDRLRKERTCARERQALKEAVLPVLETLPHGARIA